MKRKKPYVPRGAPPIDADVDFIVGTVEKVTYHEPIPPGGTRVRYVRGQGLVFEKIPMPGETVDPIKPTKV